MSLKGKDNQAASEDVLKLAPQVLYIFSLHIYLVYLPIFIRSEKKIVGHALCIAVISALLTSLFFSDSLDGFRNLLELRIYEFF